MDIIPYLIDNDDDFVLYILTQCFKSRVNHNIVKLTEPFDLYKLTDDYCWIHFRFYKADIVKLCTLFDIPAWINCGKSVIVSDKEAICIVLKRLSYPNRYFDLMKLFPRTRCELSRIFNRVVSILYSNHSYRLRQFNQPWLTLNKVQNYAEALRDKGCTYHECFGFIDGTVRATCRPSRNQREFYNGHKRVHGIKFQSVLLPDGLVINLFGPSSGRRHDAFLLQSSKILGQLQARFYNQNGAPYHLYGDPAYPLTPHLMTPFKAHVMTRSRRACNKRMSRIRESVEWGFCKILQLFSFLDYKKNLRLCLQPVHMYYSVGVLH